MDIRMKEVLKNFIHRIKEETNERNKIWEQGCPGYSCPWCGDCYVLGNEPQAESEVEE